MRTFRFLFIYLGNFNNNNNVLIVLDRIQRYISFIFSCCSLESLMFMIVGVLIVNGKNISMNLYSSFVFLFPSNCERFILKGRLHSPTSCLVLPRYWLIPHDSSSSGILSCLFGSISVLKMNSFSIPNRPNCSNQFFKVHF